MDDGSLSGGAQYYLNTQGFQKHEVTRLCHALKDSLGINANVQKDGRHWRIYITAESNRVFEEAIKPYLHENFYYKIRANYRS